MNELIIKNPITNYIEESIKKSKEKLNFAVPFVSDFALDLFKDLNISKIKEKRMITRFDNLSKLTFNLKVFKILIEKGFEIRYDNSIHLKLYIADKDVYITSSNLTESGFEKNIELTVKTCSENNDNCEEVFNQLWENSIDNKITLELVEKNWANYLLLKKQEKYKDCRHEEIKTKKTIIGENNIENIIDYILNQERDHTETDEWVYEANKERSKKKNKILKMYNSSIFYVEKGSDLRKKNLFYDFVYGYESKLAGTGLREEQFKTVFEHSDFENVINYIVPEKIGSKPWNFNDKDNYLKFCNGLFDFKIPQYSEALPIRLASYFYPDVFIPIFKLDHLKQSCEILGLKEEFKTKGEKLHYYNDFLLDKMKSKNVSNYIKSHYTYKIIYTIELFNKLYNGETFEEILKSYKQNWIKDHIQSGYKILKKLNIININ